MAKVVVDAEFGWLGETNPEQDIITPMKHNKFVNNGIMLCSSMFTIRITVMRYFF